MSDELLNPADVALDPDESGLYDGRDALADERGRVQQLVADSLADALARVVEIGVPEELSVDFTVAQGEAGAATTVNDTNPAIPDLIADGNWQLAGIVAIADSAASADPTVTIGGLIAGVSIAIKCARTILIGGQAVFVPLHRTIRAGQKPGDSEGGITCVVSGGATNDKVHLSFVFRRVRGTRVQGLGGAA